MSRLLLFALLLLISGCTVVYQPPPMSMGRGRDSVVISLARSEVIARWLAERPSVATLPMLTQEGTRAPVGDPVLAAVEHWLVLHHATVVARDRQDQMICEIERQSGNAFDPRSTASLGKQLGTKWFVTGTVTPVERYRQFRSREGTWVDRSTIVVSIIEAETSRVLWEDHLPLVDHSTGDYLLVDHSSDPCESETASSREEVSPTPLPPTRVPSRPEPTAPAAPPFAAGEAAWELGAAATDAAHCPADASVPRSSIARITFANDGRVARVELDDRFENTATGECVKKRYGSARIPAFRGKSPTLLQRLALTRSIARSP